MRDPNTSSKYDTKVVQFIILIVLFFGFYFFVEPSENNLLWRLPPLIAGLPFLINDFVSYLMYDFMPVEIYDPDIDDYEKSPIIKEITRSISSAVLFCIQLVREILVGGVKTIVSFTSWDFVSENFFDKRTLFIIIDICIINFNRHKIIHQITYEIIYQEW